MKMDSQKRIICRLCLKIQENFDNLKAIEQDIKYILDKVLQKTDFAVIQDPLICANCADTLMKCFEFKEKCINTHDYIAPFINGDTAKLDLMDVYISRNDNGIGGLAKVQNVCGLCLSPVKKYSALSVDIEGNIALKKRIEQCVPELDMNIIEKPVICLPCHVSLENCFSFLTNCLTVEEKIKKYSESRDIDRNGGMDQSHLLQLAITDVTGNVGGSLTDLIKVENQFSEEIEHSDEIAINGGGVFKLERTSCNDGESSEEQFKIKSESFMETDELIFNSEEHFTPVNVFAREDVIEMKPFCEQSGLKQESFVKVEDQKCLLNDEIDIKTDESDLNRFEDGTLPGPKSKSDHERHLPMQKDPLKVLMYKCDSCQFETKCKTTIGCHLLNHRDNVATYKCWYQARSKSHLNKHLFEHKDPSEVTMYKCCDLCSYQTKSKRSLKGHSLKPKDASEVTMYKCDSCTYQTKSKRSLKVHSLKHKDASEVTMYKCSLCPFQTKLKASLKPHMLTHKDPLEVTMHKCNVCLFQTKHKISFNRHLLTHMDPSEVTMYKCNLCSHQTKHKRSLKVHALKHKDASEVTMYKCDLCLYETKYKNTLEAHLLKHKDPSEVTMYKCDSCLFQTKHEKNIKRHKLTHKDPSQLTIYKCDSCLYQTMHKHNYKEHLLKHKDALEVRMYKCDLCLFETKYKNNLDSHLLRHRNPSQVTMYKCESCLFQTRHEKNMNRHLLKHKDPSEVTMYKCGSCLYQTNRKDTLKEHLLKHKNPTDVTMYASISNKM